MPDKTPSKYWVIRHLGSGGSVVAKFKSDTDAQIIPDEIADYGDFQIQQASGRSALGEEIDQSGLTNDEKKLLSRIYPVHS